MNYARKKGFDPLVPGNWYQQERKDIVAEQVNKSKQKRKNTTKKKKRIRTNLVLLQGGNTVLDYYCRGFKNALTALFPEIGLDGSKLKIHGMKYFKFLFLFCKLTSI